MGRVNRGKHRRDDGKPKRAYADYREACRHACGTAADSGRWHHVYRCGECGLWHVGRVLEWQKRQWSERQDYEYYGPLLGRRAARRLVAESHGSEWRRLKVILRNMGGRPKSCS
jgi:hypothetical protein